MWPLEECTIGQRKSPEILDFKGFLDFLLGAGEAGFEPTLTVLETIQSSLAKH
jgi:hypothetical protein